MFADETNLFSSGKNISGLERIVDEELIKVNIRSKPNEHMS